MIKNKLLTPIQNLSENISYFCATTTIYKTRIILKKRFFSLQNFSETMFILFQFKQYNIRTVYVLYKTYIFEEVAK